MTALYRELSYWRANSRCTIEQQHILWAAAHLADQLEDLSVRLYSTRDEPDYCRIGPIATFMDKSESIINEAKENL